MMKAICHAGFVGIDVSKEWLDIAIDQECFRVVQTQEVIDEVIKRKIKPSNPLLCVVESTGGYERLIVERLQTFQLNVHVAHPLRVRTFAQAKGLLAKTDKLDAYVLSAYGQFVGAEAITPPLSVEQQKLRDLKARHTQVKEMLHAESCRFGNCVSKQVKNNIKKFLTFLKKELESLDIELQNLIEQDESLNHYQKILRSMKGVGVKTAQAMLIHLPELGRLSRKQIASLVGVAPMTKQSGKKQGHAKIQQGRGSVRHVLYMAALVASRFNPVFKQFYDRLVGKGKPAKVALVAIMRKMLVTLNAMIRDNRTWKYDA
jgi:transposase